MALLYGIQDRIYNDYLPGSFTNLDAVIEEFRRLAAVPWDQEPNLIPFATRQTFRRIWTAFEDREP